MLVSQQVQGVVTDAAEDEDDANVISTKPTPPSPTSATTPPPQQELIPSSSKDKIAQAIEITKIKQRVMKLEKKKKLKASGFKRLRKGRLPDSQAQVYHLDIEHAQNVLSMQETDKVEPAEVEEVLEMVIVAKLMTEVVTIATTPIIATPIPKESAPRRRKGVIIQDPEEAATVSQNVQSDVKS
nr:hypothetical protein [Tanacetum cinerariifolium]